MSSAEFAAIWAATGQDRLPFPFRLSSDHEFADTFAAEQHALRSRFARPEHALLEAAVLILAEPQWRIEVFGWHGGPPDVESDATPIRMIGAAARGHGVVALQHAGPSSEIGGDVAIRGCEPYDLARQMVAQLPLVEAGMLHPVTARRGAHADERRRRALVAALNRPASGSGVATVIRGPRHRPATFGGIAWRDIADDGRYLVYGSDSATVVPGDSWDLLAGLHRITGHVDVGEAR
nr:ESX secretion-associated protein EspG [Rhodococcus sp. HNM0569]